MSGTQLSPTIRQEPSGATSVTTATAIVIVANYAVKLKYGVDIPADVGAAMGAILFGAAHAAQTVVFWYLDARVQPKPLLPPPVPK
jgi:hypothetical protein